MTLIKPDRTSGLLKARVVGRRIYGPSEFRSVNDPHCKWPPRAEIHFSLLMTSGLFGTIRAQSHFWPIKGPCFLWARDIYTCKWPIFIEGPNYV